MSLTHHRCLMMMMMMMINIIIIIINHHHHYHHHHHHHHLPESSLDVLFFGEVGKSVSSKRYCTVSTVTAWNCILKSYILIWWSIPSYFSKISVNNVNSLVVDPWILCWRKCLLLLSDNFCQESCKMIYKWPDPRLLQE